MRFRTHRAGGLRSAAGTVRHLLALLRSQGESQADWEGLLQDLVSARGWKASNWVDRHQMAAPGLGAAIPTVYPRVRHQRRWVHKMRNLLAEGAQVRLRRSEGGGAGGLVDFLS